MLLRNSPHKDPKKNSPLKSQGIIKDSPTERCCFTDPYIDKIRHCFPANTLFKSFDPTALSDYISETWVAFPVTPFLIGYSYPFPQFTQSFFSLTGISYIQAMPMIWRVLYTLERIIGQEGIDLGMAELAEMYDLTTFGSTDICSSEKLERIILSSKLPRTTRTGSDGSFLLGEIPSLMGRICPKSGLLMVG